LRSSYHSHRYSLPTSVKVVPSQEDLVDTTQQRNIEL